MRAIAILWWDGAEEESGSMHDYNIHAISTGMEDINVQLVKHANSADVTFVNSFINYVSLQGSANHSLTILFLLTLNPAH